MATYSYKVYKKQVSYDGGTTWYDVEPIEKIKIATDWGVECSGLTYAAKISKEKDCVLQKFGKYEYFISEGKNTIEVDDVEKLWGTGGAASLGVDVTSECSASDCNANVNQYKITLSISPNCTEIGDNAFSLRKVNYSANALGIQVGKIEFEQPSSLKKIGSSAFRKCGSDEVILPDSVEEIGEAAFYDCSTPYLSVGSGITYIGPTAFSGTRILAMNGGTPPVLGRTQSGNIWPLGCNVILVPSGSVDTYVNAWESTLGSYVNSITTSANTSHSYEYGGTYHSGYSDSLTAITTDNVKRDVSTTWVKFGDSVVEIGDSLFTVPYSSTYFKDVSYVLFGNNVKKIGSFAFKGTSIAQLDFPNSLEEISESAFESVGSIRYVNFGNGLKKVGNRAFALSTIGKIELPDSLEEIGDGAFSSALEIVWPNNSHIKKIGSQAFSGAYPRNGFYSKDDCGTVDVVLPEGIEEVGSGLFAPVARYNVITSITFPSTLKRIGSITQGCDKIILLSKTPPVVEDKSMSNIEQIYVPCESVMLYRATSPYSLYPQNIHAIEEGCTTELKRWISFGYKGINGELYPNEIEQVSYDSGATWENTGQDRQDSTSVGSSSYQSIGGILRYGYQTGATPSITSLGAVFNNNMTIDLKMNYSYLSWWGDRNGYVIGDDENLSIIPYQRDGFASHFGYIMNIGNETISGSCGSNFGARFVDNSIYNFDENSRTTRCANGTHVDNIQSTNALKLFSGGVAGGVSWLKIYNYGVLIRNFEPRYLTALNTATLYDTISQTYCEVNGSFDYF